MNEEKPFQNSLDTLRTIMATLLGVGGSGGVFASVASAERLHFVIIGSVVCIVIALAIAVFIYRIDKDALAERKQLRADDLQALSAAYVDCMTTAGQFAMARNPDNAELLLQLASDLQARVKNRVAGTEATNTAFRESIATIVADLRQQAQPTDAEEKTPIQLDA